MSNVNDITPGFAQYTENDHTAWLLVASFVLILITIFVTGVRIAWRHRITRTLLSDDWLVLAAATTAIGETAAITVACKYGVGKHEATVSQASHTEYSKSLYASQLLTILAIGISKASAIETIAALKPHRKILLACHTLQALNLMWIVAGIFSFAFQCSMPEPWTNVAVNCVDQWAMQNAIWAISIFTDMVIIVLPSVLMMKVQISSKQRWAIATLFGSRIIVPIMTILGIVSLRDFYRATPRDQSWDAITPLTYFQFMMNFSITMSSVPSIKRFVAELRSHAFGAEITMEWAQSGSGFNRNSGAWDTKNGTGQSRGEQFKSNVSSKIFQVGEAHRTKIERCESIEGLTDNIIMQTIDFKIEVEDGRPVGVTGDRTNSESGSERKEEGGSFIYSMGAAKSAQSVAT